MYTVLTELNKPCLVTITGINHRTDHMMPVHVDLVIEVWLGGKVVV